MKPPGRLRVGALFVVLVAALTVLAAPSIGTIGSKLLQNEALKDPKPYKNETRATVRVPETADIPRGGIARNFRVVGYNPLLDSDRGRNTDPAFDQYINPALNIPRGSNGDITLAGDCVYVGSFVGYQSALIVDVSR